MSQFWKKILFFILLFNRLNAALDVEVESECALLINSQNGKVLFEKNASQLMSPASCTKVAFALYAIKFHKNLFDQKITCSRDAVKSMPESQKSRNQFAAVPSYVLETDASHMGLKVGEVMSFYEYLEGTMIVSADDASNVIAEAMGNGSIEKCVQDVNAYVVSIGCKDTHFTNPHGLFHPNHKSTAYDLARMCQEGMKEPIFAKMVKKTHFQRPKTNKQEAVTLRQTNRLLHKSGPYYYPQAVGIKTGYHRRAGFCLVAQAEKNGRHLISVIFRGTKDGRYVDTRKLFDAAFEEKRVKREVFSAGPQTFERILEEVSAPVSTYTKQPLEYCCYPSEAPNVSCQLVWIPVILPLKKGANVGELQLLADGKVDQKVELFAAHDVELNFMAKVRQYLTPPILVGLVAVILIFLFFLSRP
ncbi:MAG: D-alanyl-D-alanine carboxypeptidase family protein [Parachlamydiaceae bacterium]